MLCCFTQKSPIWYLIIYLIELLWTNQVCKLSDICEFCLTILVSTFFFCNWTRLLFYILQYMHQMYIMHSFISHVITFTLYCNCAASLSRKGWYLFSIHEDILFLQIVFLDYLGTSAFYKAHLATPKLYFQRSDL